MAYGCKEIILVVGSRYVLKSAVCDLEYCIK